MPDKKLLPQGRWYRSLPQKRMGAGILFFNRQNEILLVKPSYKKGWTLPGGVVDADESPKVACQREVKEELGLNVKIGRLLCLDYYPTIKENTENIQFVFAGGFLNKKQIAGIKIDKKELIEIKFLSGKKAVNLLGPKSGKRIPQAVKAFKTKTMVYLEKGIAK